VAIIDWDVHVANGAERIFWDRADVLALSLHQRDWYPAHAGDLCATGGPRAEGCTVNVPLPPATTGAGYLLAFDELVAPIVRAFAPDVVLVAAGQNPAAFDPTGRMLVSAAGFRALARASRCWPARSPRAGWSSAQRAATARSTTRSACSACSRGWPARTAGCPIHGAGDATVRAAQGPADDRVRDAVAAVRLAQQRWFS
jgi:histone deacetylase-like protein